MAGGIRGITVEIGGDTTKLGKALSEVNSKTKSLQGELKGVNKLLKMDPSNTTLLAQKQQLLTRAIDGTKEKLETLKTAQEQAQEQFERGEITEEQYRDLQREIIATEQKLEGLTDELKEFGSVGAQKVAQVGEKMQEVGGKIEDFGKKVSTLSVASGAILAGSVAAFVELDEGYDTIITKTGATGKALEDLNTVADNIFGSMPTDMATVGIAVGEINTRFGYTGEQLEALSTQFIQFAEINGVDLNNSIGTVDKVLEQFNMTADDAGDVLDLITVKAQQTGIGADKLMNLIQDNGATLKDMGIGVREAVVLLSQFEANGVNVESALKGLKKATVEYAKKGVTMQEGLSQTIAKIKNAKTETEALAEVEKLFGAKGANEMVKAIRENRLSVEDLTVAMSEYGGTVADTFNATLDPIDQGKVAMNNLKLAGSELAGVLQSTFAPILIKIVEKIKSFVQGFDKLSPSMKKAIVIALSVTTVLGPIIIGIGKVVSLIGQILTFAPAIKTFITTLNASLAASPWGAIAVSIGAVVAALAIYNSSAKETKTETEKMCEEMDEFNAKVSESAKAYDEAKKARSEAMQGTEREFGYYQQLTNELADITDENGKVIAGYEARANTITGILSRALGQEITTDQMVAQGKQTVIDKINQLINAKKAEIHLSSNEEAYTEAIKNSADALNIYTMAKEHSKRLSEEIAIAEREAAEAAEKYRTSGNLMNVGLAKNSADATTRLRELQEQQVENNKAIEESQKVYLGYQTTIQNYEGLSSAIIEGDAEKINVAISNLVNGFITAELGTEKSLKAQVTNAETQLANLQKAFENGAPGVTQAMVDEAQNLVNRATAEYNKLVGNGESAGAKSGQAIADGVNSKSGEAKSAGKKVAESAKSGTSSVSATSAGANFGQGFVNGILSKLNAVWSAAMSLANRALSAVRSGIQEGSPSRLTRQSGKFFGEGFEIGIKDSISGVLRSVDLLVSETKNAFLGKKGFDIHSPSRYMEDSVGKEIVAGLIKGVNGNKDNAKKSAQELAQMYISETENVIKNKKDWQEIAVGDEIFLWEQLKSNCKKGSDEYKNIELKLFEAHEQYVADERDLNNMSVEDEMLYWRKLASTCDEGSVLYKYSLQQYAEANKEYETTFADLRDERLEEIKKTNDVSLLDQVKYWEDVLKSTESTFKGYSDVQLKLVNAHKNYIEDLRANNDISVQDEMVYWINLLETFEEGTAAYQSVMTYFREANKEYETGFVDDRAQYVDKQKELGEMSLADEVTYWRKLLKITDRNSKNYAKIQEKIYYAEKDLSEKSRELKNNYYSDIEAIEDKLTSDIQGVREAYDNAVSSRQKSIVSSMGLFDAFKPRAEVDKYTLADNLGSQVEALKEWDATLDELSRRKGLKGSDLLSDLQDMGVDSLYTLQQINAMTDEELQSYINLYNEKNKIALERATVENERLKAESESQIRQLTFEANRQLDELESVYIANMEELGLTASGRFKKIGKDMVRGIMDGMASETANFQRYITDFLNSAVSTAQSVLDIHSPSRIFAKVIGRQIPAGIAKGILDNSGVANKAIRDMSNDLINEASLMNGATINRKLNATFTSKLGDGRTLTDVMNTMIDCSNKIYDRLNRLQIVLDSNVLVGETIDKIDAGLANRQILTARGI